MTTDLPFDGIENADINVYEPIQKAIKEVKELNPNLIDLLRQDLRIFNIPVRVELINILSQEMLWNVFKQLDKKPDHLTWEVTSHAVKAAYDIIEELENDIKRENARDTE